MSSVAKKPGGGATPTPPAGHGGRLPLVPVDAADPRLQAVFSTFLDSGREVPALYRVLGNSPALLQAWTAMAWPLRREPTSSRGLRELMIMRVAHLTQSAFEWTAHWDAAVKHGISVAQLEELDGWATSEQFDDDQRAVLAFTDELTVDLEVTDPTWQALAARHDASELVELIMTAAFYSCVSRVLGATRLDADVEEADGRLLALRRVSAAGSTGEMSGSPSMPPP